jgi:hypothetical protein
LRNFENQPLALPQRKNRGISFCYRDAYIILQANSIVDFLLINQIVFFFWQTQFMYLGTAIQVQFAGYKLGIPKSFSYQSHFFGHVKSDCWMLYRLVNNYIYFGPSSAPFATVRMWIIYFWLVIWLNQFGIG